MELSIWHNADQLGQQAAKFAATAIKAAVANNGSARIVVSTGASQFETFKYLVAADIPWAQVEMFHLDEYVALSESHPASFRKYLKERFVGKINLKQAYFVNGEGDLGQEIAWLSEEINKAPIDLSLIGIGENAHIAFNDPPADFTSIDAYMVVNLDDACKRQQVGEGWFESIDSVPKQAITMTVQQILRSNLILSCVPHKVKAEAIRKTLELEPTNLVPATILKTHPQWVLYLDQQSASLLPEQYK